LPEAARAHCKALALEPNFAGHSAATSGFFEDTDILGVPHFLATQYFRPKGIKPQFPEWVRQFHLVRVHHEHREELGRLALGLTPWRSPGS